MRIISGMHRSGTSLMGQLFHAIGADMGDPDTFYPADRWNPEGYFEQTDIITINKALLHGPYWKFAYFILPSARTVLRRARRHAETLTALGQKYNGKVIKGPRFCLTLPAWQAHGATIDGVLVCLRDPIQVAHSIKKRNISPLWHGLHLWYVHNRRLLDHLGDLPVWYAYYGNIMNAETSVAELAPAFRFFGHDLPADELQDLVDCCVKTGLHNHTQTEHTYPRHIQQLWDDLRARHAAQFS